ncbi:MAG: SPOR domain-containing protein [Sulfuricella sp.]|nr:SPOR domain-containing protein [Sulfuricella sp.]
MANGPSPTVEELQLRKRARRRLVGAITLVALMVAVLPMILDDEPKPVGQDIAIDIPSQQSNDFPLNTAKPPPVQPPSPAAQPQAAPVQQETHAAPAAKATEPGPEPVTPGKKVKPAEKTREAAANKKEAKPATKTVEAQHGSSYIVMLGAFLSEENARQRQAKLKELGVKYYLEKIKSPTGEKTGVRAGPYSSRQEAEQALARLKAAGIADGLVTEKK